ncbi:MAG: prolipoprotein diacylglyceryl transferase [Deltaproteobacteria bacterium]|nr:prolipoprotein diacylglyceryl transferase [Deltaproteobacteria bacterium]
MTKAYFVWNIDPELFSVGPFSIRFYGLFFAIAFMLGYSLMSKMFTREGKRVQDLDALFFAMFLSTLIGARLGHCLFYESKYYLAHPLEILMVWHGGLASHGAAVGIMLGLWLYSRKHLDQPYLWLVSRMSITVALAGFFIRMGNFFNSEILGHPTAVPWAVVFSRVDAFPRHPAQLYESLSYLLIFFILNQSYKRRQGAISPYTLTGLFFTLIFSVRFVLEYFKEAQATFEYNLPLHMGQLLSIPLIFFGLYCLWRGQQGVKQDY